MWQKRIVEEAKAAAVNQKAVAGQGSTARVSGAGVNMMCLLAPKRPCAM